jgi:hypothetical protein
MNFVLETTGFLYTNPQKARIMALLRLGFLHAMERMALYRSAI